MRTALVLLFLTATLHAAEPPVVATFSILGYDPKTGEVGGAVQSRVFSVGNGVLCAGTGVVATQAVIDGGIAPRALGLTSGSMR